MTDKKTVSRRGKNILFGSGVTAREGRDGGPPTLTIRKNGKEVEYYRGSALYFNNPLTEADKEFLLSLVEEWI